MDVIMCIVCIAASIDCSMAVINDLVILGA